MLQREFIEKNLAGEVDEEELEAHFSHLPEQYFKLYGTDDVCTHIRLINRFFVTIMTADGVNELEPVVSWANDKQQGRSVVTVTTWDREGLFYKIAGAFARAGINIFAGKSVTRNDHISIMTFSVADRDGGAVSSNEIRRQFSENLREILVNNRDIAGELRTTVPSPRAGATPLPAVSVAIFCGLEKRRLIIELEAPDRIGLLYEIGKILFLRKLNISLAQLSVKQGLALGTFRVITIAGTKIKNFGDLEKLREELLRKITAP